MGMKSKRKGRVGEAEWVKILNHKFGVDYARTPMSGGMDAKGDVIKKWGSKASRVDDCHFEIKRQENLNIHKAIEQAQRDCRPNKIPVVAHRRSNDQWKVTMYADDFLNLVKELDEQESENKV